MALVLSHDSTALGPIRDSVARLFVSLFTSKWVFRSNSEQQSVKVDRLALTNELPDVIVTETGLRISPQDSVVPDEAKALIVCENI